MGQSPRFGQLALQGLALRQGLSPSLKSSAWVGRRGCLGAPESDLRLLQKGGKKAAGSPGSRAKQQTPAGP